MKPPNIALLLAAPIVLLSASCRSSPIGTIPEPLPETLEWEVETERPRVFLGLRVAENASDSLDDLSFEPGVRVEAVVENSPAERAGLRVGDVVLRGGERAVEDPEAFDRLVQASAGEESLVLHVRRGDAVFEVETSPEAATPLEAGAKVSLLHRTDPARSAASWATTPEGVRLVARAGGGPVAEARLKVGSTVRSVEGRQVLSARELIATFVAHDPGDELVLAGTDPEGQAFEKELRLRAPRSALTEVKVPILLGYERDPEGEQASFVLIDLWVISLLRYERDGGERHWRLLRFFRFSSGVGELSR